MQKTTLTALYGEGAHGRVEGEDVKVAFTVENKMAAHGVKDCPIGENTQSNVAGVQVVLRFEKSSSE